MNENVAKFVELFDNADFVAAFDACADQAAIKALAAEHGVELSDADLESIIDKAQKEISSGELSESALENVAGGGKIWNAIKNCVKDYIKSLKPVIKGNLKDSFKSGYEFEKKWG